MTDTDSPLPPQSDRSHEGVIPISRYYLMMILCVLVSHRMSHTSHGSHTDRTPARTIAVFDMETSDSSNTKRFVCNCNQHCRGQPRFVSQATFYRHLANAEGRERDTLKKIKTAGSLDAARTVLANAASFNDHWQRFREQPDDQPRPSRPVCASARRAETIRAMVKRAREAEPNPRRGKRKCARNKNNIDSNASYPSIFNIEVTDLNIRARQLDKSDRDRETVSPPRPSDITSPLATTDRSSESSTITQSGPF